MWILKLLNILSKWNFFFTYTRKLICVEPNYFLVAQQINMSLCFFSFFFFFFSVCHIRLDQTKVKQTKLDQTTCLAKNQTKPKWTLNCSYFLKVYYFFSIYFCLFVCLSHPSKYELTSPQTNSQVHRQTHKSTYKLTRQ